MWTNSFPSGVSRLHKTVGDQAQAINNLNQLAKWANANRALPPHLDRLVEDLAQAVMTTEETTVALGGAFELGQGLPNGPSRLPT